MALLLAGLAGGAPTSSALLPSNETAAGIDDVISLDTSATQCLCWQDHSSQMVFYNRVPKCGSTTMVNMMDEVGQEKGTYNGKPWEGFAFVQSQDYDYSHFDPSQAARKEIINDMITRFALQKTEGHHSGRVVFERHLHFIDFTEFGKQEPVYLNVLRDPASLRASSFYFNRDCICNQQHAHGNPTDEDYDFADEWCKADWWRKSESFCGETINSCYATPEDVTRCQSSGQNLGGAELTDFLCGATSAAPECVDPSDDHWTPKFAAKVNHAIKNLQTKYRWVGVLEQLEDSLTLLQNMLPNFFGNMDAKKWGITEIAPDGSAISSKVVYEPPSASTQRQLMQDPYFMMEQQLYDHAKALLSCKMQKCGVQSNGVTYQRDLEVQADKSYFQQRALHKAHTQEAGEEKQKARA